nr:nucleotidyltransferase family protein [Clavibacter sp. VKM Ac-2873]
MHLHDERAAPSGLDPERRLLLGLSRVRLDETDVDAALRLIRGGSVRWGVFLERAAQHKVLPLVGRHLLEHHLARGDTADGMQAVPSAWIYPAVLAGNRERNRALAGEAEAVTRALERRGVAHALQKGLAVAESLYGDIGARRVTDVDLLVARGDADATDAALRELGYVRGTIAWEGDRLVPSPDPAGAAGTLPYLRPGPRPDLPVLRIDLAHSVFADEPDEEARTREVLGRSRPSVVDGRPLSRLDPADELLDLCVHLHAEATRPPFAAPGVAMHIGKFVDVTASAGALDGAGWDDVLERTAETRRRRIVHHALHFADAFHPGSVPPHVLDATRPADTSSLDVYRTADRADATWSIPFPERLFAAAPVAQATAGRPASVGVGA